MQDRVGCARYSAGFIYIFHTHEPQSVMRFRIKVTGHGGNEGARVQRAGRGGRKAADVGGHVFVLSPSVFQSQNHALRSRFSQPA